MKTAYLLFSGGLDSIIAAKVLQKAGFEVKGVHFKTPFFGKSKEELEELAKKLGVELQVVDITEDFLPILENPPHGFGKNANPCIDCKALMLSKLKSIAGNNVIATGEVLGQRPMSQRGEALKLIEKIAGLERKVLRPLSGKLLPPSVYEEKGLVKKEELLDIKGRSRKKYPEIIKNLNIDIENLPTPAGGCLLTQPGYAKKVIDLLNHNQLTKENTELLRVGRHLRIGKGKLVVGKSMEENKILIEKALHNDIIIYTVDVPGPTAILRHTNNKDEIETAAKIVAGYSDGKGKEKVNVAVEKGEKKEILTVTPFSMEEIATYRL